MPDALGILAVLLVLAGWLAAVTKLAAVFAWPAELARKAVHVGMGLACLSFPSLFASAWPVWTLAALAAAFLLLVRRLPRLRGRFGASLHGVERRSLGDILFPLGIATVFWAARGDPVTFGIPVAVLTLGDAVGAVGGARYGMTSYASWRGRKSVEGSVLFLLTSFLLTHLVLLLGSAEPRLACVLTALVVALTATAIEGVLGDGWDNFVLPVGTWVLLDGTLERTLSGQALMVGVALGLFSLILLARRWSSLDGGGLLAALLYGYGCAALGGLAFLWPPLALFAVHLFTTRAIAGRRSLHHRVDVVAAVAAPGLFWLFCVDRGLVDTETALLGHVAANAALLAMMHAATRRFLQLRHPKWTLAVAKPLLVHWLPWFVIAGSSLRHALLGAAGLVLSTASALLFARFTPRPPSTAEETHWWWRSCAAWTVSCLAFFS